MKNQNKTPLYKEHLDQGAKMTVFAGWEMPLYYTSIIKEQQFCRNSCCIFDISHMGEFLVTGPRAIDSLDKAVTHSINKLKVGKGNYGFILNSEGGIIDDLIIFKLAPDKLMLVVNASTKDTDFNVLKKRIHNSTNMKDISLDTAKIDVQGPHARKVIKNTLDLDLDLKYFNFSTYNIHDNEVIISRTGYTGELGYEIFCPSDMGVWLWNKIIDDDNVCPAGLGARDILRLEMGYSLYGEDIDEQTTPLQAGLGKFINFEKDFIGKQGLLKEKQQGLPKVKIGFKMNGRRSPRRGYKILNNHGVIGNVTSGCFSPSLNCGIGMGYINPDYQSDNSEISIYSKKTGAMKATIEKTPFYKKGSLKN
ncbi:MAG: glycine cleavage system aminomethyltransferase GcvT [Elusimicrobiota bacterium]